MKLKDKIIALTGGSGVLCSAIAEGYLAAGAKVALISRTLSKLEQKAEELKAKGWDQVLCCTADVNDPQSVTAAAERIQEEWGPVDVLVNGAGGNNPKATSPLEELLPGTTGEEGFFGLSDEAMESVFHLNFQGTMIPSRIFGKQMVKRGSGSIINISSMAATLPMTKVAGYAAAKAAVDNFTRWLSVHFAKTGVRVNAIAPGFFLSEQNRFLLYKEDGKTLSDRGHKIINATPMGRFGEPEELQSAAILLADESSRFITGIIIPVDGGFSAYSGV